jgi:hypothetical protein
MRPDVTLTASQFRLLERYARTLPMGEREPFRHSVLDRLRGAPSLHAVEIAIGTVLGARPMFMLAADRATKQEI